MTIQKWDYKTVVYRVRAEVDSFEIDDVKAEKPKSFVALFKRLGQEGWELCAHSASSIPGVSVLWWVFKRTLS